MDFNVGLESALMQLSLLTSKRIGQVYNPTPESCKTCIHKRNHDVEDECYMFKSPPKPSCAQYKIWDQNSDIRTPPDSIYTV